MKNTIFALSSGSLPSGVAIIRISGSDAHNVAESLTGRSFTARESTLCTISNPVTGENLDQVLVLKFDGPNSFTGEDIIEFHCHGGRATVSAVLDVLGRQPNCKLAEAGEFSRRAFENGKMDLTELEGLSDLISAQTDHQRRLALCQSGGALRALYDGWRQDLVRIRALIEAELDFSDEEDVPGTVSDKVWTTVRSLSVSIEKHLDDNRRGEIIRDGFKIVLLGPPNAGKSSLLNALADRDVAIVTPVAGTTRDVVEVSLNFEGLLVTVSDTAGLRDSTDEIEQEGVRRAILVANDADLILWLEPPESSGGLELPEHAVPVRSKSDLFGESSKTAELSFNTVERDGLNDLIEFIKQYLTSYSIAGGEGAVVTRQRHRNALAAANINLTESLLEDRSLEIRSEYLRCAADEIGRITGRIDVEDLLDVIFSEFCVGK